MTNSGISHQGEGSGGPGFGPSSARSTSWRQTLLTPVPLVQVRLDVGWHAAERIGMYSAECYVPNTRELLALEVHPSARYDSLEHFVGTAHAWQRAVLLSVFDPDPF